VGGENVLYRIGLLSETLYYPITVCFVEKQTAPKSARKHKCLQCQCVPHDAARVSETPEKDF